MCMYEKKKLTLLLSSEEIFSLNCTTNSEYCSKASCISF